MSDFNWSDISDNMDWNSLGNKNKSLPNSGNANQSNINQHSNFDSFNRGRGRGRGRGGGANHFNNKMNYSDNPNFAPLGNNKVSGNFSDSANVNEEINLGIANDIATPVADEAEYDEPHGYASGEVQDWNDMKQFDDDHDNEWFIAEENKMAEKYGGKFIKVRYTTQGRVGYHCELCSSECNAKKSLELHCGGMKHLKKKDLWEKQGRIPITSEENPIGPVPPSLVAPKSKKAKKEWGRKDKAPMKPPVPFHDSQSRGALLDPPYMRKSDPLMDRHERIENLYGKDRYLDSPEEFSRLRHSRSPVHRRPSPPVHRRPSPPVHRRPSPPVHRRRSPSPVHRRMLSDSPERRRTYSSYSNSSPPYDHHGGKPRSDGWSEQSRYGYPREKSPLRRYSIPSPPHIKKRSRSPSPSKKLSLAGSPAGALLQKLAECCVKTDGDADLALSVVAALTKSMKEYSYKNNEVKIAELLMEAELKIGTVKALKAGMKMLSTVSSNAIIAKAPQLNVAANPNAMVDPLGNFQYHSSTQQAYGAYSGELTGMDGTKFCPERLSIDSMLEMEGEMNSL